MPTPSCRLVNATDHLTMRDGFLFYAPASESLTWDVENLTASTSRRWISEEGAWWVAASYRATIEEIVRRHGLTLRPPRPSHTP